MRQGEPTFGAEWLRALVPVLVIAAFVEGAFLQIRDGYFTGSFLQEHYTRTPGLVLAFFAAGALHDGLFYGTFLLGLLVIARLRGRSPSDRRVFRCSLAVGAVPVAFVIAEYHVLRYFTDLTDLFQATAHAGGLRAGLGFIRDEILRAGLGLMAGVAAFVLIMRPILRRAARLPAPALGARSVVLGLGGALAAVAGLGLDLSLDLHAGLQRKLSFEVAIRLLDRASDRDGDGFGSFVHPRDPDPFDARVHPYGRDVPGDGIDQDGIGGDLAADALDVTPPVVPIAGLIRGVGGARRDVVLIVLESFRADLLGRSYQGREVCPNLNRLAARGASAGLAYSHRGYTGPSLFQLLTGRYQDGAPGTRSLFEDLRDLGYQTAAFSCPDQDFCDVFKLARMHAAEVYFDAKSDVDARLFPSRDKTHLMLSEARVNRAVREFLTSGRDAKRPLFLFINYQSTHFPYSHRETRPIFTATPIPRGSIRPGNRDWVEASYLNAAANVDQDLGDLVADLGRKGLLDEALVVVTSDHGESLYDGGFLGHGHRLTDWETRVPFIVLNPGEGQDLVEPLGLAEVPSLVKSGLARPRAASGKGFRTDPAKRVFQYIDDLAWPKELGWVTAAGRTRVDLARHLVREERRGFEGEARPRPFDPARDGDVRALIHAWERLRNSLP